MGFEPMNTGFADQRVSHFATGALFATLEDIMVEPKKKVVTSHWALFNFTPVERPCGDMVSQFCTQERSYLRPHWRLLPL
jgi:hypothetical protein